MSKVQHILKYFIIDQEERLKLLGHWIAVAPVIKQASRPCFFDLLVLMNRVITEEMPPEPLYIRNLDNGTQAWVARDIPLPLRQDIISTWEKLFTGLRGYLKKEAIVVDFGKIIKALGRSVMIHELIKNFHLQNLKSNEFLELYNKKKVDKEIHRELGHVSDKTFIQWLMDSNLPEYLYLKEQSPHWRVGIILPGGNHNATIYERL